jgi:hypothetical protein
VEDQVISDLLKAVTDRQSAVSLLLEKYATGIGSTTDQLASDLGEVFAADRLVFEAIITALSRHEMGLSPPDEALVT